MSTYSHALAPRPPTPNAQADAEQAERGDESDLHIIIFDEIDAICKKRGSTRDNTGVHDSVVNQVRRG